MLSGLATALACAALSPIIVARRWAFVGEGVGHSSYGGAGLVWLAAACFPAVEALQSPGATAIGTLVATLIVALGIGRLGAGHGHGDADRRVGFDTAVGIFLVASLAVGFLARQAFVARFNRAPTRADALLFGAAGGVEPAEAIAAGLVALAVVAGLWLYRREVLAWTFDPQLAELNGVRSPLVRDALLIAIALTVATGARVIGAVLVTGLLVLPGATAALAARRPGQAWAIAAVLALLATALPAALLHWAALAPRAPLGPVVVLLLTVAFITVRLARRRSIA